MIGLGSVVIFVVCMAIALPIAGYWLLRLAQRLRIPQNEFGVLIVPGVIAALLCGVAVFLLVVGHQAAQNGAGDWATVDGVVLSAESTSGDEIRIAFEFAPPGADVYQSRDEVRDEEDFAIAGASVMVYYDTDDPTRARLTDPADDRASARVAWVTAGVCLAIGGLLAAWTFARVRFYTRLRHQDGMPQNTTPSG